MKFSKNFDHTMLKADANIKEIENLCYEAIKYDFASVCVNPSYIEKCKEILKGTNIDICTVIGFPLGASTTEVKIFEAKQAIELGATELDMVINISKLKNKEYNYIEDEIRNLKQICGNLILKVIIETCLLEDEEKIKACELTKAGGADFVKTSTGMSKKGATVEDVKLMRRVVGGIMGVKASGGIKTLDDVNNMLQAGASRVGCSSTVNIINRYEHK